MRRFYSYRSIQRNINILLLSFTGIKSSGTILGSHEWHFEKLENFASTFKKNLPLQESINKLAMPKTKFFNYDILEGATAPARVKLLLPPGFREEELYTFALVVQV